MKASGRQGQGSLVLEGHTGSLEADSERKGTLCKARSTCKGTVVGGRILSQSSQSRTSVIESDSVNGGGLFVTS